MNITYRTITDRAEYEAVADLEILIWGVTPRGAVAAHTLHIINQTGGCVIGAFDGDRMAGFVFGFAMHDPLRLWSHIAGVHPDYQRQGIGYQLKQEQRQWALTNGYRIIHWTFDPLQALNAHFNFRMLGVTTDTYHVDFYGQMPDKLNQGMPTDRFQVAWQLDDAPPQSSQAQASDAPFLLTADADGEPVQHALSSGDWQRVEIPRDINAIRQADPDRGLRWLMALRAVVTRAFDEGYQAVDFSRSDNGNWYVLRRKVD